MKNKYLFTITSILAGVLFIVLPKTILHPCNMHGKCRYSAEAVALLGILLITLGIIHLLVKEVAGRIGHHILALVIAIEAILIPALIIGGCDNKDMACQSKTFPGIYVVSILYLISIAISLLITWKGLGSSEKE